MTEFRELSERYQLKKILRSTRFGSVLRAIDSTTGQAVAIKLIPISSPERLQQGEAAFVRFASVLRSLRHPNLPAVGDSGFTADGSAFLVLEWLDGEPATAAGEIPVGRAVAWVLRALSAVEELAERGLAHHNLTSDNLFLATSPEGGTVKLLGLGAPLFRSTGPGWEAGWPPESVRFQPPELGTASPGDLRVDIYALARIACELLGATIPPGNDPPVQLPLAVSFELENEAALRHVLEGALLRDPAARPSPTELRQALQTAVTGAGSEPEVHPLDGTMADLARPSILDAGPLFVEGPGKVPAADLTSFQPADDAPHAWGALDEAFAESPRAPSPPSPGRGPGEPRAGQVDALPPPPSDEILPLFEALLASDEPLRPMASSAPAAPFSSPPAQAAPPPPLFTPPAPVETEAAPGDVLSAIDDELLNALLAVPPAQEPAGSGGSSSPASGMARVVPFSPRQGAQARTAAAPQKKKEPSAALRNLRKPAVLGTLAGILVLGGLGVFWLLRRDQPAPPPPPAARVNLPPPPTVPPIAELEEAKALLAQGKDYEARQILQGLSYAQQGLLPPERCSELAAMEAILSAAALEQLPLNLAKGLETGELRRLQQAVAAAEAEGSSLKLPPEAEQNLTRARVVVGAYGAAQVAASGSKWIEVLQKLAELHKAAPKLEDPEKLREKAAGAVEEAADKLARDARYDDARNQLELIKASWPERAGLAQRLTALATYKDNEKKQTVILAGLNAFERRRKPHEGIDLLNTFEPTPHLEPQFKVARQRLEDLLSRLDQQVPKVLLRDGFYLEYQKGAVVELSFRVTDDYQVKSVRMMARPKGGGMREVRLTKSTFGYTAQIPPSLHRNADVDFYVVATDLSGHEGYLGTPTQPQVLRRQQGFERIVR